MTTPRTAPFPVVPPGPPPHAHLQPEDDPSLWTELHPDRPSILRGDGLGRVVRLVDRATVVREGTCTGVSLVRDGTWTVVVDGTPVVVAPGTRVFAAVPIPAVPLHPRPAGPDPGALLAEIEEARDRVVTAAAAMQAMAEESAALLEAARRASAARRRRTWCLRPGRS